MLLIKDILISDAIFEIFFHCDLQKCKGACCWEGDYGAPLNDDEIQEIEGILPLVKSILPEENVKVLETKGPSEFYKEPEVNGTSLMEDFSCVYLIREPGQTAKCAFEILYNDKQIQFKKPISCELYPIRLIENEEIGFTAMNYDEWEICKAACTLGEKKKLPVFRFLKKGLIRKFGEEFYEELESFYNYSFKK